MYVITLGVICVYVVIKSYFWYHLRYCTSIKRLYGKTVLITGGSKGIGYHVALDIARRGARVIITSSDKKLIKCNQSRDIIINETNNQNVVSKYLDLQSLKCVREFAKDILENEDRLDILINNAGNVGLGNNYSEDGLLLGLQVNYFGPFLLTHLLIDLLKKSKPGRIVNVASNFSQMGIFDINNINKCPSPIFSDVLVYCTSKLFTVYMTWQFADKLKDSEILVNCVHTGYVATDIWNKTKLHAYASCIIKKAFFKTPEQGAQTSIHAAVSEEVEGVTGKYFDECKPHRPCIKKDLWLIDAVWDKSIQLVKLKPNEIKV